MNAKEWCKRLTTAQSAEHSALRDTVVMSRHMRVNSDRQAIQWIESEWEESSQNPFVSFDAPKDTALPGRKPAQHLPPQTPLSEALTDSESEGSTSTRPTKQAKEEQQQDLAGTEETTDYNALAAQLLNKVVVIDEEPQAASSVAPT